MGEMEGMGQRGRLGREEKKVVLGQLAKRVNMDLQVYQELRGRREWLVLVGQLGRRVHKEIQVCKEIKGSKEYRAHQQEEQSTLAGVGPPAPLAMELSSSMLGELGVHLFNRVEDQQSMCVYQMILTIFSIRVEYRDIHILVEWSITMLDFHLSLLLIFTMFPVLCVMRPPGVG